MHATPFNADTDIAPIPFDKRVFNMAAQLKEAGLSWKPHVGCFVWDPEEQIKVPSPFPKRVYFILNLGRFMEILGSVEQITEKLVWIPTWHQARELALKMNIEMRDVNTIWNNTITGPADELLALYSKLLHTLQKSI